MLATIVVAVAFALVVAWVAALGTASDGNPRLVLSLSHAASRTADDTAPPALGRSRLVNGQLVFDPALAEDTSSGPLPRIAPDGRRPMTAYAARFNPADKRPRIAIVLTGLGIGASDSTIALARLPPAVTFAFSPFAPDVQTWVDQARAKGHEVLIEIPMEPFDFPDSDPGPRTLMVAASTGENEKRLTWMLTRFTGYVGAVNGRGGRFLSEAGSLEPVIRFLAHRGILWVDVSNGDNSATAGAAQRTRARAIAGALRVDAIQTPEAIDAKLLELEDRARGDGAAVGVASLYPVSVDRLAAWADVATRHGFALVPITAAVARLNGAVPQHR